MLFYQRQGNIPPKRYTVLRREQGGIYHEELLSTEGFTGASSTLYRLHPPTRIRRIEELPVPELKAYAGAADNMLFRPDQVAASGDIHSARVALFANADVIYSICRPDAATDGFYRNGSSDEVMFVVAGSGTVETAFGVLEYREHDLVVIPRGITFRWLPSAEPQELVVLETHSPVGPPARYRSTCGQLLDSAPYHERDVRTPRLSDAIDEAGEFGVHIKAGGRAGRYVFDRHPFDAVGWDGYLYPYVFNVDDYEPISGRVHPLPDQYQIFGSRGVAICIMMPHPNASDPNANPAQAHHMNLDYDELMYRFARTGPPSPLSRSITFHPRSLAHGPKPGYENMPVEPYLDMWAFMVDAAAPLEVTFSALDIRDESYRSMWL
jgi:homogentisate 1,2-dioxygenase